MHVCANGEHSVPARSITADCAADVTGVHTGSSVMAVAYNRFQTGRYPESTQGVQPRLPL